jgi:uncharacterized membrane protein (DUF4010 family)
VSSTGVTLSFAQRSQSDRGLAKPFALGIMIAWTVMFARVVIEVAVLNWLLFQVLWVPMLASAVVGLGYCLYPYFSQRTDQSEEVAFSNPLELAPAVRFGFIYAAILVISRAAQMYLGKTGKYLSRVGAGLADVDAITLSMAQLSQAAGGEIGTAARAVVLATMANTVVKGGVVLTSGARALRRVLWAGFRLLLATGLGVAFLVV